MVTGRCTGGLDRQTRQPIALRFLRRSSQSKSVGGLYFSLDKMAYAVVLPQGH